MGNYTFNWDETRSFNFVDGKNKMMLCQNSSWNPSGDNGKGDSIGRTWVAYYTYGDKRFIEGIEDCWVKVERKGWLKRFLFGKYYNQGYRYPTHYDEDFSRDHLAYTLIAFKYAGYSEEFIKDFVKHLCFRISKKFLFTIDLWCWAHTVANIKPYTIIYPPIQWLVLAVSNKWNKFIYKHARFEEEFHQEDFIQIQNSLKPAGMIKLANKLYPIFSLHIVSWQIKLLRDSKWKKRLQKIALTLCPKHNYAIQLLLQSPNPPSLEDIESYKSMRGGRWTTILNPWINDRDLRINEDLDTLEWNVQDVDYVRKLHSTISCFSI